MATECCVCMDKFKLDGNKCPKLLPCTHTLCLQCLRQLSNGQPRVKCPECCTFHDVSNRNANNFQTNRYMLEILEGKEKIAQLMWLSDEKAKRTFEDESGGAQIQVNNKFPVSRNAFCSCA